jgi:hypothetical protein
MLFSSSPLLASQKLVHDVARWKSTDDQTLALASVAI